MFASACGLFRGPAAGPLMPFCMSMMSKAWLFNRDPCRALRDAVYTRQRSLERASHGSVHRYGLRA
jgi:hypothetical protein